MLFCTHNVSLFWLFQIPSSSDWLQKLQTHFRFSVIVCIRVLLSKIERVLLVKAGPRLSHHSAGTPIDSSCLICSGIAENDEVVPVKDFVDVGNIMAKSWVTPGLLATDIHIQTQIILTINLSEHVLNGSE